MAIHFTQASSQYLSVDLRLPQEPTDEFFTAAIWAKCDQTVNTRYVWASTLSSQNDHFTAVYQSNSVNYAAIVSQDAGSNNAKSTEVPVIGKWQCIISAYYTNSLVYCSVDGKGRVTSTDTENPNGANRLTIGGKVDAGAQYYDGALCEFVMWDRVTRLTQAERLWLGRGVHPFWIQPERIMYYFRLRDINDLTSQAPAMSAVFGKQNQTDVTLTAINSPVNEPHPPIGPPPPDMVWQPWMIGGAAVASAKRIFIVS